ncbi:hypothetical protein CAEBREN_09612 [Caenorhabditis brenneri]|uniref:Uncharacterized protein n=1 Tax=Caenorhabditis brenneri TaxID=135651 RepID=G0PA64_CAEBE|nr:hypothetical protein CAEBREN_09612 [Caenorhabditis brenneri]
MSHPTEKDETLHKIVDTIRDGMEEILGALRATINAIRNNPLIRHVELDNEVQREIENNAHANRNRANQFNAAGEVAENDGRVQNPAYREFIDEDLG